MQVTEVKDSFSLDNLVPFFQPIMDLDKNAVSSYECLARLLTFEQNTYLPAEFLFLVERQQSVSLLTQTIFSRSATYFRDLNMAWNINLSLSDMTDPDIHQFLYSQLRNYPNPNRISIEITAQNALAENGDFETFAALCNELGVNIVIDHFDQVTCDLNTILSLPISALKVSAKLFEQIEENSTASSFIKQLISLAAANNIAVVAERIEYQETLDLVKEYGVKYAQGFYFSQPKARAD